jgi:hypothetical protein
MSALNNFSRWVYLMQQVHAARYYIARAEEMGHPHLLQSYEAILEFLAHFESALNAYAKCFVSAGLGRRRCESSSVFGADADRGRKHQKIMELRHKYVSHSDENEFESVRMSEEDGTDELVLNLEYNFSFPFDRLYELRDLIRFVEAYVIDSQQNHVATIARECGKPVRVMGSRGRNA